MCGIFGAILKQNSPYSARFLKNTVQELFVFSESRGKQASGALFYSGGSFAHCKDALPARRLIRSKAYRYFWDSAVRRAFTPENGRIRSSVAVIGHTRLATNGTEALEENNQPVITEKAAGVHNGIVVNSAGLDIRFSLPRVEKATDSWVIFNALNVLLKDGLGLQESVQKLYRDMEGSASVAVIVPEQNAVVAATNTGSLYFCGNRDNDIFIFASELPILEKLARRLRLKRVIGAYTFQQVAPFTGVRILLDDLAKTCFTFGVCLPDWREDSGGIRRYVPSLLEKARYNGMLPGGGVLKRCAKCILPETIPYIEFDGHGVCNYCHTHKKIRPKGEEELAKIAGRYRSKNGRPDCLVAFSGGRDSAYSLHYVKRVLKMNPIAFTFDWGMVADIARRNQARMVGKLGVEHVIISADINRQRSCIRENVNAWLHKPHLGMVVLFMAGDKPAEYYVKKVAKEYGIKLIFLARGNEFENTDFKWGFLGLPRGEPDGVLHNLSFAGRVRFSLSALRQFISNPRYFNRFICDTFFAYWSTYVLRYDYLYIWHYLPWDESRVVDTLKKEYNWETAADTIQTWRTDDGTSPFYNYIYYTLAGFTENDCFRSNQIREGVLKREDALKLVLSENWPRYEAIRDYLGKIGLDYETVLRKIREAPRLYRRSDSAV